MSNAEIEEHASFAAEQGRRLDLDREFAAEVAPGTDAPERRLVTHYLRRMDARGSEVKLDLGLSFRLRPTHRASVQTTRWVWRHVSAHRVRKKAHIRQLELAAVDMTLKWRLRSAARGGRDLHLVDSQVVASVLSEGRCASRRLLPGLRRIGARLVAGGLVITFAFCAG